MSDIPKASELRERLERTQGDLRSALPWKHTAKERERVAEDAIEALEELLQEKELLRAAAKRVVWESMDDAWNQVPGSKAAEVTNQAWMDLFETVAEEEPDDE